MCRKLIGSLAVTLTLAACSNVIHCSPCNAGLRIYVSSLRAGSTAVRTCVDSACGPIRPIREAWPAVSPGGKFYDPKTVELLVYRGSKLTDTYSAVIVLQPPDKDKTCDCGESRQLTPGPNGSLVECKYTDETGCTSRDPQR